VQFTLDLGLGVSADMDDPDGFLYCVPPEFHEKLKKYYKETENSPIQ
jgi:hypothetical protein